MLFGVGSRVKSLISAFVLYHITLLSLVPLMPVRAASSSERHSIRSAQTVQTAAHVANEVLVRFRSGISQADKDIVYTSQGAHLKKKLQGESAIERLELPASGDAVNASLQLNMNPAVEFAEPNFLVKSDQVAVTADDPRFAEQWALKNLGQNGGQYGSDIDVIKAWQTTTGQSTTVIAVIDSGIDFTHPDLANNEWNNPRPTTGDNHGWDFITNSGAIKDERGHGTAIAGIIAAQGNNAVGVSGVMWRTSLMSLRVLDEAGNGDVSNAVEAIDY